MDMPTPARRSIIQPQIAPLFDGVSDIELLHTIINGECGSGYDLVRQTWQDVFQEILNKNGNGSARWDLTAATVSAK